MTTLRLSIVLLTLTLIGTVELFYPAPRFLPVAALQLPQSEPLQPEHRDDAYMEDPHARCMRPEVVAYYGNDDPSIHSCTCHLVCVSHDNNSDGVVDYSDQGETQTCALYCSKQRCACHPDDPCNRPEVGDMKSVDDGNPFDTGVVPR